MYRVKDSTTESLPVMSFLLRAGLTFLTIGMLNAFGWVGTAEAAHCSTIFKLSPQTDSLGTATDSRDSIPDQQLPDQPVPILQVPFDFQPGNGTCGTDSGPVRGAGWATQSVVAVSRTLIFLPKLSGRMPIPSDLVMTNASTAAIFEPPRLCE